MSDRLGKQGAPANTAASQSGPDRATLLAFLGFVVIAGSVALTIRFVYSELQPFWSGTLRFGVAALIFMALMVISRVSIPHGRALLGAVLFGLLSSLAITFVYYGLTKIQASTYQILGAIMPLVTLLLATAHRLETISRRSILGGLLAVVGIVIAVSGSLSNGVTISLPHILSAFVGIAFLAEAGIVIKLFPPNHPYATNAVAMTIATIVMATASIVFGESWALPTQGATWLALLYLIVGSTVGIFLLYLYVLKRWTATGASYGFVLSPIVTVVLAALLTDETISAVFLVGAVVVLAGVYVGALMPAKKEPKPVEKIAPPLEEPALAAATASELSSDDIQVRPGLPNCI